MKMSDYRACCGECFNLIVQKNSLAAKFWMNLCKMSSGKTAFEMTYKTYEFFKDCSPEKFESSPLRFLENLGFLVSVDTDLKIIIKMKSIIEEDGILYCGGKCA